MESNKGERDEPLTPAGRLFLRPEMNQVINCVIGVKNPVNADAIKAELRSSVMLKHPRFSSLLVKGSGGREYWRKTQINVDEHVIVKHGRMDGSGEETTDEDAVNDYLADLSVSSPLSEEKPLWELHVLTAHNCFVLRVHHALGDGISLMSLFLSLCRRVDDPTLLPTIHGLGAPANGGGGEGRRRRRRWPSILWEAVKMVCFTVVFVAEFLMRSLWLKDKTTSVSGGAGVELWPRKLATAKLKLDDMKQVKKAIANATINDVLFGIVSYGLSKYLNSRSPQGLKHGLRITGVAMVNLRPQPGLQDLSKLMETKSETRWGNKFGMMLLPIYYHKGGDNEPLEFLKRAKKMIDKKKLSLEAICSYKLGDFVMSNFGPKCAGSLNYRIVCNTTFTISNVVGPREEIAVVGNPITYIRVNSTSLPHAITMHMVSYAGRADMQILVAKDIIPDVKFFAKCFEDALLEMKELAKVATVKESFK